MGCPFIHYISKRLKSAFKSRRYCCCVVVNTVAILIHVVTNTVDVLVPVVAIAVVVVAINHVSIALQQCQRNGGSICLHSDVKGFSCYGDNIGGC